MSAPLIVWIFMILMQQQGLAGGAGADKFACQAARTHMIDELKEMGQDVIAMSDCVQVTLTPPDK